MHLEHDDLGKSSDRQQLGARVATVKDNRERVVLRGAIAGEVTVNLHAYRKLEQGACPVKVTLYRLRGDDSKLLERTVNLSSEGEEMTVFRFTLDGRGELRGHNELSKRFVDATGARAA